MKVYCENCKYMQRASPLYIALFPNMDKKHYVQCTHNPFIKDTPMKKACYLESCYDKNKNNNCRHFKRITIFQKLFR